MGRTCTICVHDERHQINVALVAREPFRAIASRFGVSKPALQRHASDHIPKQLVEAYKSLERSDAESLVVELANEKQDVQRLKRKAEEGEDYKTALMADDKALKALELQAKIEQLIASSPTTAVNIALVEHPDYTRLEDAVLRALEQHPEARWAVADALKELEAG
jgi:hypothetical protein